MLRLSTHWICESWFGSQAALGKLLVLGGVVGLLEGGVDGLLDDR